MPKRLPSDLGKHIENLKAKILGKGHGERNAFLDYVAARVFVEETLRVTDSLIVWCRNLQNRGVIVDQLLLTLQDFRKSFVSAAEHDLQENLKSSPREKVELSPFVPDDAIGEAVWLAKAKFYDREVFLRWLRGELATPTIYNPEDWKFALPFMDYAWWCFVSELDKYLPDEYPLSVGVDYEDNSIIVNACGWKEILPLSGWQLEEIQKHSGGER